MNNGNIDKLKKIEPKQLHSEYKRIGSIQGVLKHFGISGKSRHITKTCKELIEEYAPGSIKQLTARSAYSILDIEEAVKVSMCMSDVMRMLNLSTHGSNANTIKRLMHEHKIDYSHFDILGSMNKNKKRWSYEDTFKINSPIPRGSLRHKIIKYEVFEHKCVLCGNEGEHNGQPLSLTVDHINGISDDNRIENLRWLCPNCHSQTENYCAKNKRK